VTSARIPFTMPSVKTVELERLDAYVEHRIGGEIMDENEIDRIEEDDNA
jgi:hypothetical protein